jgi:hypothetical protein
MKHLIRRLPLCAFALLALGCDVFDESLIPPEQPGEPLGEIDLKYGDELSPSLPANYSYADGYHNPVPFDMFNDNSGKLPACLGRADSTGVDIFFKVDMNAGERWHFHALSSLDPSSANPAIYILNTTIQPEIACPSPLWGANACPAGSPEHFTFLPGNTQSYYIGVDELAGVPEPMKIFAAKIDCGNGVKEHSEYCDPSVPGAQPVDDCEECRKVLENGGDDSDLSFNDGPHDATVLKLPRGSTDFDFSIQGKVNTACDFDFFKFSIDFPAKVTAQIDEGGCENVDLGFWNDESVNPFELSNAPDCVVQEVELHSGTHWVRIFGRPGLAAVQQVYVLRLVFARL